MPEQPLGVLRRLVAAVNAHDIDAFVGCFAHDYHSEQPIHPGRTFDGAEQVRKNWTQIFAGMPDFHGEVVRSAIDGDRVWSEWDWTGTRGDIPFHQRGVMILGVRDDRIAWGRLYLENVTDERETIDEQVRSMSGRAR
jgi:hypothetical protein